MNAKEYICSMCKNIYISGLSDKEAIDEATLLFPNENIEDMVLICDACDKVIIEFNNRQRKSLGLEK